MNEVVNNKDVEYFKVVEKSAILRAAKEIKRRAEEEVLKYVNGEDFTLLVENMKRRKRQEINSEIEKEREEMMKELESERRKLFSIVEEKRKVQQELDELAGEILLQNKIKMENLQRREYEAKLKRDADRLQEIQNKKMQEEVRPCHDHCINHINLHLKQKATNREIEAAQGESIKKCPMNDFTSFFHVLTLSSQDSKAFVWNEKENAAVTYRQRFAYYYRDEDPLSL